MSYLSQFSLRRTRQGEPVPGTKQVPNSAGGFAWAVDDWTRLRRFLILGSEASVTRNDAPPPTRSWTQARPSWSSANFATSARPTPEPEPAPAP